MFSVFQAAARVEKKGLIGGPARSVAPVYEVDSFHGKLQISSCLRTSYNNARDSANLFRGAAREIDLRLLSSHSR